MLLSYLLAHWIEMLGTALSLVYLYLSIKQNIGLWLFGLLSSALYVVVFLQSKFYADMTLQVYYVGVSIYGYWNWRFGHRPDKQQALPVISAKAKQVLTLSLLACGIWAVYYIILVKFTDSPLPLCDALTTALSIVATWMLAKKILEHWLIWIFVDAFSAGLYFYKDLNITAVLYIIYAVMAVIGYFQWRADARKPANL